ncbi:MAG: endonuclease/exonuclease/phosphatase family protein [Candidatus Brocadiia bacterium]
MKRFAHDFAGWLWTNVTVGAFGAWLVGEIFRDGSRLTALCLFLPSAAVALALMLTALLARLCRCRRIAWAAALLWLPPAISLLFVENQWLRPAPAGEPTRSLRLVHWNVGGAASGETGLLEALAAQEADIYVLSEYYGEEGAKRLAEGLGEGFCLFRKRQLTVFARGPVRLVRREDREPSRAYFALWSSPSGPVQLLLVDLPSRPVYYRGSLLARVRELMAEHRPDLVVGDFNTTRRSKALAHLPPGYAHAYYEAGAGWSATWPDHFPLWDIDQCILGPRVRPVRYDLVSTGLSDHRMQVFDFELSEVAGE